MTYVQKHHRTLGQHVHGEPDLETKLLVWMLIKSSNRFYTARFDEVMKSMMKAKRWKRVDSKEGRAMDRSVNTPSHDTMHTYKTLVDCAATRMILCYIHSLPEDYIEVRNAGRFGATFTSPKLYGPAYTEAPVKDPSWFLQTLGIIHTKRGFEENCLNLLWAIPAAAGSQINMAPAVLAASRMMEAKEMPDIIHEIAAFSAKAVWEWLELRVKASRREGGMPDALNQTEIFDLDWDPKSAVIEFMELKIEHKELHAAEGVQYAVDFNMCHRAKLQKKLLTGLLDFGIKVNDSLAERNKCARSNQVMVNWRSAKTLQHTRYGVDLIFVDGPFGLFSEVWDTYSTDFYSYMGGICMSTMDYGGIVILFLPDSTTRSNVTINGKTCAISRQQAIIDAFCASTTGWPLKWTCHQTVQYWNRGGGRIGNNAAGPVSVLQPYVLLHLVEDPSMSNKLPKWAPLRSTVGKFANAFTNIMATSGGEQASWEASRQSRKHGDHPVGTGSRANTPCGAPKRARSGVSSEHTADGSPEVSTSPQLKLPREEVRRPIEPLPVDLWTPPQVQTTSVADGSGSQSTGSQQLGMPAASLAGDTQLPAAGDATLHKRLADLKLQLEIKKLEERLQQREVTAGGDSCGAPMGGSMAAVPSLVELVQQEPQTQEQQEHGCTNP
ncbi:hypothetical protein CYMTET_10357 [Cymbomonas tetramitiformis]|uniref:Uncharacterized protein n=1 Tax=Cymbomonas tetramitiformis TaxID=36881 RepID=A0AAE0GPH2_9CHLO|nr:hypothetical protein CYMTET_10357 [Cymbomonas tetramitiformis]